MTYVYLVVRNESYHYGAPVWAFGSMSDAEAWIDDNTDDIDEYRVEQFEVR